MLAVLCSNYKILCLRYFNFTLFFDNYKPSHFDVHYLTHGYVACVRILAY